MSSSGRPEVTEEVSAKRIEVPEEYRRALQNAEFAANLLQASQERRALLARRDQEEEEKAKSAHREAPSEGAAKVIEEYELRERTVQPSFFHPRSLVSVEQEGARVVRYQHEVTEFKLERFPLSQEAANNKKSLHAIFLNYPWFTTMVNFLELSLRNPEDEYYTHQIVYGTAPFDVYFSVYLAELREVFSFLPIYCRLFEKTNGEVFLRSIELIRKLLFQDNSISAKKRNQCELDLDKLIKESQDHFEKLLAMILLAFFQLQELIEFHKQKKTSAPEFMKCLQNAVLLRLNTHSFSFQEYLKILSVAEEVIASDLLYENNRLTLYLLKLLSAAKEGFYFANIKILQATIRQQNPIPLGHEKQVAKVIEDSFSELDALSRIPSPIYSAISNELVLFLENLESININEVKTSKKFIRLTGPEIEEAYKKPVRKIDAKFVVLRFFYPGADISNKFFYARILRGLGVSVHVELYNLYLSFLKLEAIFNRIIEKDSKVEIRDLHDLALNILTNWSEESEEEEARYLRQLVKVISYHYPDLLSEHPELSCYFFHDTEIVLHGGSDFITAYTMLFLIVYNYLKGEKEAARSGIQFLRGYQFDIADYFFHLESFLENPKDSVHFNGILVCADRGLSIAQSRVAQWVKPYGPGISEELLRKFSLNGDRPYLGSEDKQEKQGKQEKQKVKPHSTPRRLNIFASTHKKAPPKFGAAKEREKRDKEEKEEKAKAINEYNERIQREKEDRLRAQSEKRKAKQKKKKGGRGNAAAVAAAAAPVGKSQAEEVSDVVVAEPAVVLPQAVVVPAPEKKKEEVEQEQEQKSQHIQLTAFERDILSRIKKAGPAFYVGGLIRKRLKDANAAVNDLDIVIKIAEEKPKEILQKIFQEYEVKETNSPNTFKIKTKEGIKIDIRLSEYLPDLEKDALSRDFTLAAAYCDETGLVEDPLESSVVHAKNDVIMTIIDAEISFGDPNDKKHFGKGDPIRMLRATRLRANTDYPLSDPINDAIKLKAALLKNQTPGRVNAALRQSFLDYENADKQFEALCEHPDLLDALFPGLKEAVSKPFIKHWLMSEFKKTNTVEFPSFDRIYETLMVAIVVSQKKVEADYEEGALRKILRDNRLLEEQFNNKPANYKGKKGPDYQRMISMIRSLTRDQYVTSSYAFHQQQRSQQGIASAAAANVVFRK